MKFSMRHLFHEMAHKIQRNTLAIYLRADTYSHLIRQSTGMISTSKIAGHGTTGGAEQLHRKEFGGVVHNGPTVGIPLRIVMNNTRYQIGFGVLIVDSKLIRRLVGYVHYKEAAALGTKGGSLLQPVSTGGNYVRGLPK
jgi:hypothetical protein